MADDERSDAERADSNRRVPAEPVPVLVEQHGEWWPGRLVEWARWDDTGWRGFCTWSVGPGQTHMMWVPAARIRERDSA